MKKHIVLLISQKDYEHILKHEVWSRDSELKIWNWVNVGCIEWIWGVKCFGGFISYLVNSEAYLVRGKTA